MVDVMSENPAPSRPHPSAGRSRWAAIGAAVAVAAGAIGGVGLTKAAGDDPGTAYTAVTPCRLVDTRPGTINVGVRSTPLAANETLTITARGAQGECKADQLPASARAVALNLTALAATELSFLTFWPDGTQPNAASLNPAPGQPPVPNAVTTQLSTTGSFNVFNSRGNVHIVVDVVGYYTGVGDVFYTKEATDEAISSAVGTTYTKKEADEAISSAVGALYTQEQVDEAIFGAIQDLITNKVVPNADDVRALKKHIESKRTVAVNRYAFDPSTNTGERKVDSGLGVFIPFGSTNDQLIAPVTIPSNVTVTGIRALVQDVNPTEALRIDLFQVTATGTRQSIAVPIITTGDDVKVREFSGSALFSTTDGSASYEIVVERVGGKWGDVGTSLQLVGVFIDYQEIVVLP